MKPFSIDLLDIGKGDEVTVHVNNSKPKTGAFLKSTDDALLIHEKRTLMAGTTKEMHPFIVIDNTILISLEDVIMIVKDNNPNNSRNDKS